MTIRKGQGRHPLWRLVGLATLTSVGTVWAGRPLTVDDADPVDVGQIEAEAGFAFASEPGLQHGDLPIGLTGGLFPGFEAGVAWGGQFERRKEPQESNGWSHVHESGLSDLTLGIKWQFLNPCPLGARHALATSLTLPTADEERDLGSGHTDVDLTWIVSRSWGDAIGLHLNVGLTRIGGPDPSLLHYGLAADYQLSDSLQWVGELFAERELMSDGETVAQFNSGVRWTPWENLTLDTSVGSAMTHEGPEFTATLGMTVVFDMITSNP